MKKKRILYLILASILSTTTVVSATDCTATVIKPETVIREEKVFDSEAIDTLSVGTEINIKEILDGWYKVALSDEEKEGWISSQNAIINDKSYIKNNLKKGKVTASVLNVRIGPSTDDSKITQIYAGNAVTIINESGKWYEVILSNNMKGWVHSDYIKITYNLPTGKINTTDIKLKQESADSSKDILTLKKSDTVYIKGYVDNWYNVITNEDESGWIKSEYITIHTNVNRSSSSRESFSNIKPITEKYLGKRYVYGATGPNSFDCSGFSYYILNTYYKDYLTAKGITNLPRTASGQATIGEQVSRDKLQPGDLVFFDTSGSIGNSIDHLGIYIGNGEIIHASTSRKRIVKDSLSSRYYSTRFMKAVRL